MALLRSLGAVSLCLAAAASLAADDNLSSLTKAVTAFKLANGAQFFVVERSYSPIVAFHLRVKAGVADEPSGRGGLAALALLTFLEGSETYGSRNTAAEKAALAEANELFEVARVEQAKGDRADEPKRARAEFGAREAFQRAVEQAIKPRYFESILQQNGTSRLEFRPAADFSDMAVTLPSNRAELWFRMVSSWLQAPTARFFTQNRERVTDQRQRASKSASIQRERALASVFSLHPYQALSAGDGELSWMGPAELISFLKTYYVPANLTIGIVGDIQPAEARRLAELYFAKLPAVTPPEPKNAEALKPDSAQPFRMAFPEPALFAAAWPRPAATDKSDIVFEVLNPLLGGGPGSPLFNELMVESRIANRLTINSRYPGGRYSGMFVVEAEPLPSRSLEDIEAAVNKVLESAAEAGVTQADLDRARQWWRRQLVGESRTAASRAAQLARLHTEYGTYKVEDLLARIDAVTAEDCNTVIREYLAGKPYFSLYQLTAVGGGAQ